MLKEHKDFIVKLIDNDVSFLLIGGYAVIYHGYPRMTNDMDIWLKPTEENKQKFISLMSKEGIEEDGIQMLSSFDFTKPNVFFFGEVPMRIDFLTQLQGIKYHDAERNKVFLSMDEKQIPILCFNDLVITKMISGRPKDIADLDELKKINNRK